MVSDTILSQKSKVKSLNKKRNARNGRFPVLIRYFRLFLLTRNGLQL